MDHLHFTATALRGMEQALAEELSSLGLRQVRAQRGAVGFQGPLEAGYRACLWSRLASRVLLVLDDFPLRSADQLYRCVTRIPWSQHLDPGKTLAVDFVGRNSVIRDGRFGAMKTKDAVVDRLRKDRGRRPSVDLRQPDLRINLHLRGDRASLSLDLSGDALHLRGGGRVAGEAPLRETLAATLLWLAGWPKTMGPLLDPMCGAGTLLVEAAGWACQRAPGLRRQRWGFNGWKGHQPAAWKGLLEQARQTERRPPAAPLIFGSDRDPGALAHARSNLGRAGLTGAVRLERAELADLRVPVDGVGTLISNPPYGQRLGEEAELVDLYRTLGDVLRRRLLGWDCWVFTGAPALAKRIGLRPAARIPLRNGAIDCRLLHYPICREAPKGAWKKRGPAPG